MDQSTEARRLAALTAELAFARRAEEERQAAVARERDARGAARDRESQAREARSGAGRDLLRAEMESIRSRLVEQRAEG
jgi:hypothetical protein